MDKDKIEMKATMESAAVAEYLTALAKGFKSGVITVEKDGETLTLTPADVAEVEVEARVKKDKARFSLEVTWRLAQEQDDPSQLKISAEAPKADPKADPKAGKKDAKPSEKLSDKPSDKPSDKKDAKGEDKKSADQKSEMKKPEDQKVDDKKAAPAAASSPAPMVKVISPAASSAASPAASSAASPAQKPVASGTTPAGGSKA